QRALQRWLRASVCGSAGLGISPSGARRIRIGIRLTQRGDSSMTTNRRELIAGASAVLAPAHLPTRASYTDATAAIRALLDEIAEELLVDYPETATSMGIDHGARAHFKAKLGDRSPRGQEAIAQRIAQRLERLKSIDTSRLDDAARIDVDVMR